MAKKSKVSSANAKRRANLTNPPHKKIRVKAYGREANIDENLVPLIKEIWRAGITPVLSQEEKDGYVGLIFFNCVVQVNKFLDIVAEYDEEVGSLYQRMLGQSDETVNGWNYLVFPCDQDLAEDCSEAAGDVDESQGGEAAIGLCVYVAFPLSDLPLVLERLRCRENSMEEVKESAGDKAEGQVGVAEVLKQSAIATRIDFIEGRSREEIVARAPAWNDFTNHKMTVVFFLYGGHDNTVNILQGFCRGNGAVNGKEEDHEDVIGIYTAEGKYYNFVIDVRVKFIMPTFFIDETPYFYPIIRCYTVCNGLAVVDPTKGSLKSVEECGMAASPQWTA